MPARWFTLSAITRRIEELIAPAMDRTFWVKAEIQSPRHKGGSFYADLVEGGTQGKVIAQMRLVMWGSEFTAIRRRFEREGLELKLENGTAVLMECRLQYHPVYGLSLKGLDIDPAFALGEIELKKRRILEKLEGEGLKGRNAGRTVPLLPARIGLITSSGSAACRDFTETLRASGYGFSVLLADALVQGAETETSILRALAALECLRPDLIAICRGGGSKTDLSWLDNEALGRAVALCPVAVWTGIGHETDSGVLDFMAARHFKTPTAVSEELVARYVEMEKRLEHGRSRLATGWRHRHESERRSLREAAIGLRQGTRKLLESTRAELSAVARGFRSQAEGRLKEERSRLTLARGRLRSSAATRLKEASARLRERRRALTVGSRQSLRLARGSLRALTRGFRPGRFLARLRQERGLLRARLLRLRSADPRQALKRGYAMVRGDNGQPVRRAGDLRVGGTLSAEFHDGLAHGVISAIERRKHGQKDG